MKTFAIAAARFTAPSLTFMRDHARLVAPERTVMIGRAHEDLSEFNSPFLCGVMPPREELGGGMVAGVRRITRLFGHGSPSGEAYSLPKSESNRVANFLTNQNSAVLLTEFLTEGVRFMEAASIANVPIFAHAHGFDATTVAQHDPDWMTAYLELFDAAEGIFASSKYLAGRVADLGCNPSKILVSPCGIDPGKFSPTQRGEGRVLAVGRLVEKKAPHHTIAAFAKAADKFPKAHLDLVGDGPLRARCKDLIRALKISDRVTLHGAKSHREVTQLMGQTSIFVQHSVTAPNGDTEGLGISLLEAMASSVPVIATRHNGFTETVLDGETGFLIEEHDVDGMALAIEELLSNPTKAEAMGNAGNTRVRANFTHKQTRECLRKGMKISTWPE